MEPTARVRRQIELKARLWQRRMGLDHWEITHVFLDTFYMDDNGDDHKVTAITEARWQYLQAKIKWFLPSAVRHDNAELEKTLVHELCHVLLAPEQSLIDSKIGTDASHHQYSTVQSDALAERNYEHLELATELTMRAVIAGWMS